MTVSNMEDIVDSRDVIERIEELEEMRDDGDDDFDAEELKELTELAKEAGGYAPDWPHGEVLIRYSYFKEYAMQLADDIGAINGDASWPNTCIDWDQAARELKMDYTTIDWGGVEYLIRS